MRDHSVISNTSYDKKVSKDGKKKKDQKGSVKFNEGVVS